MAIPSLLSTTPVGLVVVSARTSKLGFVKPVTVRRIPPVRVGMRITACAAPCEVSVEKVGFDGIGFETSVLQCVKEGLVFHEGRSPDVIRAAAYLRALSFYTYPEGRSEEALKVMRFGLPWICGCLEIVVTLWYSGVGFGILA